MTKIQQIRHIIINLTVGKNNTINGLMTGINEMEKALPNLKGKDKQDVENSLAKLKEAVPKLYDAMKAKDDAEYDRILKELDK